MAALHGVRAVVCALLLASGAPCGAESLEPITVATLRPAGAEHGGYHEAVAYGAYRKYGLDVALRHVEPSADLAASVASGEIAFGIDGDAFQQLELAQRDAGVVTIAAIFQKNPAAVLAHPGSGVRRLEDLRGRMLLMSDQSRQQLWPWLRRRYGTDEGQVRPSAAEPGRLPADPAAVAVGDVIAETLSIAPWGDVEPVVLLPANDVYFAYSGAVQTSSRLARDRPELVQRFVDATIEGWYRYLYGDNARANALIAAANGAMTPGRLALALAVVKRHGLVDSGHALTMGIGAMDGGHWVNFWNSTLGRPGREGPAFGRLYTLQFVNQGHGLALKEALLGG